MRVVHHTQGTPEWLNWRFDGLGGSDVANVLGLTPFEDATPEALLREKLDRTVRETNFAMRRGQILEPEARRLFEGRERRAYPPVCVEHDAAPWMRCSLDGYNPERGDIIEVKAPSFKVHDCALQGIVPDYYACQVQWQLLVTGCRLCWFVSYNPSARFKGGSELAVVPVLEDGEHQATILEAAEAFWQRMCDARESRRLTVRGFA